MPYTIEPLFLDYETLSITLDKLLTMIDHLGPQEPRLTFDCVGILQTAPLSHLFSRLPHPNYQSKKYAIPSSNALPPTPACSCPAYPFNTTSLIFPLPTNLSYNSWLHFPGENLCSKFLLA